MNKQQGKTQVKENSDKCLGSIVLACAREGIFKNKSPISGKTPFWRNQSCKGRPLLFLNDLFVLSSPQHPFCHNQLLLLMEKYLIKRDVGANKKRHSVRNH